jgi:predicted lipoprotein with Yx(FWY)xxD motif
MTRSRSRLKALSRSQRVLLGAVSGGAVAVVAACGSSGSSAGGMPGAAGSSPPAATPPAAAPAAGAHAAGGTTVAVRHTSLGVILTDSRGFTLYAFEADMGTRSACSGACATAWPPVTATNANVAVTGGASKSLVGETTRPGGARQLTYAGHPLYLFQGDHSAGSTSGQGLQAFGARWDVLTPSGMEIKSRTAGASPCPLHPGHRLRPPSHPRFRPPTPSRKAMAATTTATTTASLATATAMSSRVP